MRNFSENIKNNVGEMPLYGSFFCGEKKIWQYYYIKGVKDVIAYFSKDKIKIKGFTFLKGETFLNPNSGFSQTRISFFQTKKYFF